MTDQNKNADLSSNQRLHLWLHSIDRITSIFMLAIKAGTVLGIFWCITIVFQVLSGKETNANVNVSINANANFFVDIWSAVDPSLKWAWLITVISILYGLFQQELRRRKTSYLQSRIVKLEKMIDPKRSSSNLIERGETREEDRL